MPEVFPHPTETMEEWTFQNGLGWCARVHDAQTGSFCGWLMLRRLAAGLLARARQPEVISEYLGRIRSGSD